MDMDVLFYIRTQGNWANDQSRENEENNMTKIITERIKIMNDLYTAIKGKLSNQGKGHLCIQILIIWRKSYDILTVASYNFGE